MTDKADRGRLTSSKPIDEAIESVDEKRHKAAELKELERLGAEARETFPKDWKVKLYDLGGAVAVSLEFVVATEPTATAALRKAIDDYKAAAAADPTNEKRVTGRIIGLDGKPLA